MKKCLFFLCSLLIVQTVQAARLTLVPGESIYLNPVNSSRNYQDLMLHAVVLSTSRDESFQPESLVIELMVQDEVVLSKNIAISRMVGETRGIGEMVNHGLGVFLSGQLLEEQGIAGLLGHEAEFAKGPELEGGQFLLLGRQHFSVDFTPDQLRVVVTGKAVDGEAQEFKTSVAVQKYESPVQYQFPLDGNWLMTSLPSIQSHHRFNPPTEFATDFFLVNAEGKTTSGTRLEAEKYFGYAAPVRAAADGEVVFVIDDEVQDRDAMTRRDGEDIAAAGQRIQRHNMQRYASDFARAAAGNIVVIRHEAEGVVEYSSYGHLESGSVAVKVGDLVSAGQVIAGVGDTGDSAEVHLHFQVNAGANPFFSQSLPYSFIDQASVVRGLDPGRFVQKIKKAVQ